MDESSASQKEEKDIFPKPCEDHFNLIINKTPQAVVDFMDLKDIYNKFQSRAGGGSRQRITSGLINIRTTSEGQLCDMNVFVQRTPEAATLCEDVNGRIPLDVHHEGYFQNQVCPLLLSYHATNNCSQLMTVNLNETLTE